MKWALIWILSMGGQGTPQNVELFVTKAECDRGAEKARAVKSMEFVSRSGRRTQVAFTKNEAYCVPAFPHEA